MARDLIILGASGNALDILDVVDAINDKTATWKVLGFLDDGKPVGSSFAGMPVLGRVSDAWQHEGAWFINAIGSDRSFHQRRRIVASIGVPMIRFATLIHPLASVSSRAKLGHGVHVNASVSVAGNVVIGDDVSLGPGSIVGHDSEIDDHCILAPAAVVSGFCKLGSCCYIGATAAVRQRVRVGAGALIGMGAVVLNDVQAGAVMVGNPARLLKTLVTPKGLDNR
jgi:sugar O-acyltransferase (sialic acid O-acetyltransferase NeuD family)